MKNFLFALLLLIISSHLIYAQDKTKEVKETEGGFSYLIPADWSIGKIDGMDYQMARDKAANGFAPNVNVLQEKNSYTFSEYYRVNIKDLKDFSSDYKEISTEEFTTDSGLKGKRHVCSDKQVGKNLMHAYYFFEKKDKTKIIITGSALINDKDKYLPVFDSIAKSFKTTKK
jgi:hypothetical protein